MFIEIKLYEPLITNPKKSFDGFGTLHVDAVRQQTPAMFEHYLRWKALYHTADPDHELMEQYMSLILKQKVCPSLITRIYLCAALRHTRQEAYLHLADASLKTGLHGVYPPALTLTQQIKILYLLSRYPQLDPQRMYYQILSKELIRTDLHGLEKVLACKINPQAWIAGYGSGMARLLLFIAFNSEQTRSLDTSRFQILLG